MFGKSSAVSPPLALVSEIRATRQNRHSNVGIARANESSPSSSSARSGLAGSQEIRSGSSASNVTADSRCAPGRPGSVIPRLVFCRRRIGQIFRCRSRRRHRLCRSNLGRSHSESVRLSGPVVFCRPGIPRSVTAVPSIRVVPMNQTPSIAKESLSTESSSSSLSGFSLSSRQKVVMVGLINVAAILLCPDGEVFE